MKTEKEPDMFQNQKWDGQYQNEPMLMMRGLKILDSAYNKKWNIIRFYNQTILLDKNLNLYPSDVMEINFYSIILSRTQL